ncbi:Asparagine--tRNA ligase [Fasciola gigantica]|uniref:Asparagine--tRNA ligase n=1 Tax=Fasciola gigantica TaxID=46835 RepID=A0A504YFX1_FASGI|nr:Asparagine--tRNA ligase [Fasciola gigantica]
MFCDYSTDEDPNLADKNVKADKKIISKDLNVMGWIQSVRRHKTRVFFDLTDGSSPFSLQVVSSPTPVTEAIRVGSAVSVSGDLVQPLHMDQLHVRGDLHARSIRSLDGPDLSAVDTNDSLVGVVHGINAPRPDLGLLRSATGLTWRHRLPELAAMLRLRAHVKQIARSAMNHLGYLEVDTPILTTVSCEGTSKQFVVQPSLGVQTGNDGNAQPSRKSTSITLTSSAQLHLEALALGLSKASVLLNELKMNTNLGTQWHIILKSKRQLLFFSNV